MACSLRSTCDHGLAVRFVNDPPSHHALSRFASFPLVPATCITRAYDTYVLASSFLSDVSAKRGASRFRAFSTAAMGFGGIIFPDIYQVGEDTEVPSPLLNTKALP